MELIGGHRGDREGAVAHDGSEDGVLQRTVVEIGAQRGDDADVVAAGQGGRDGRCEPVPDGVGGDEGPEFLELVDDDHERAVGGGDVGADGGETAGFEQTGADVADLGGGDASECGFEFDERIDAGHHRHHQRVTMPPGGHGAGVHQGTLAGPRWADHEHERIGIDTFDERVDESGSPAELGGIGFSERPQPLVRVDRPEREARQRAGRTRGGRSARQASGGSNDVSTRTGGGPRVDEFAHVAVPVDRDRRRRLLQDRVQRRVGLGHDTQRWQRLVEFVAHDLGRSRTGERSQAGQCFPRDHCERVLVGCLPCDTVTGLLGARIQR